ncbi:hypothetical protein DPMN_169315 [Dreissena polymorpha]|uniref:Uncharacterized protein n=1 Tax=Dreissena polymorpha TaxID=45954 RepID=A0A9D4J065_DREPO|nr:hypothetical protein DPMN_169315 [Dreissena polymorpha]
MLVFSVKSSGVHHRHQQHVEHNEKNTKVFANIEKRRSEQKTVHKLVVNGEDITNRTQILEEQRCPLSSSLFIICIEYLSHYIQSNKHIKGISLEPDEEIKQPLCADDATYFLNDTKFECVNMHRSTQDLLLVEM